MSHSIRWVRKALFIVRCIGFYAKTEEIAQGRKLLRLQHECDMGQNYRMTKDTHNTGLEALIAALPAEQRAQAKRDLMAFIRLLADTADRLADDPESYAQFRQLTK